MNNKYKMIMVLKIVAGITILLPLFLFGTMYLWNWLVPELFHGPVINIWQTIGLIVLSKILFGGGGKKFGKGRCCGSDRPSKWNWKQRMQEKMSKMSEEEKEAFKQRLKDRCCDTSWAKGQSKSEELNNTNLS